MGHNIARPYFDLCDGIFLNYNWTDAGLASSAALTKERKGEVYVGIDVFGRGCPGGGGYNSCKVCDGANARLSCKNLPVQCIAPEIGHFPVHIGGHVRYVIGQVLVDSP